tara:strand:- start:1670 stop:2866 length:1197 start_codon:yes stop_codon:yes gene_type:complete
MVSANDLYTDYVKAKNQPEEGEDPEKLKRSLIELLNNDLGGIHYSFKFVNEGTSDPTLEQYSKLLDYATDNGAGDLPRKVDNLYKILYDGVDRSVSNFSSTVLQMIDKEGNSAPLKFQPETSVANTIEIPKVERRDVSRDCLMIMLVGQRILTTNRFFTLYEGIFMFNKETETNIQLAAKLYTFKSLIESFKMEIPTIPGHVLPKKDSHKELIKNTLQGINTQLPKEVKGTGATHSVISEMLNLSEHILKAQGEYEDTLMKLEGRNMDFDFKDRENTIVINNLISNLDKMRRDLESESGERERQEMLTVEARKRLEVVSRERDRLQEQLSRIQVVLGGSTMPEPQPQGESINVTVSDESGSRTKTIRGFYDFDNRNKFYGNDNKTYELDTETGKWTEM